MSGRRGPSEKSPEAWCKWFDSSEETTRRDQFWKNWAASHPAGSFPGQNDDDVIRIVAPVAKGAK